MRLPELLFIAAGLSMDAFAAAVCAGAAVKKAGVRETLTVGLYFGGFQAAMPLIGYLSAKLFAEKILAFDHWIALALLGFIGGRMIAGSFQKSGCPDRACPAGTCSDRTCPGGRKPDPSEMKLFPAQMVTLALATSIDALAAGVSFAFLQVSIVPAVALIGAVTLVLSMAGVKIGSLFGRRFKASAEFAGGVILVLMGVKIALEHTGVIP